MTLATRRGRDWGARDDLGGSRCAACVDRGLRGAAGVVRGLEELVQAAGECRGAVAWGRAGDAVWAHVREVGDHADSREFPASQGTCRTPARYTPGPLGKKTKTEGDRQSRSSQRVSGARVFAGTQPAFRAVRSAAGGLSP